MRRTAVVSLALLVAQPGCRPTHDPAAERPADPLPPPPSAPGAMAPRLTAARDSLLLTWIEPGSDPMQRVCLARLSGADWSARTVVTESDALFSNWADTPSAAELPGGSIVAHWLSKSGPATYAYDVMLARSDDGGRTFSPMGRLHDDGTRTEHGFVSLLPLDSDALAIWLDGRNTAGGGPMTLRAARIGEEVRDSTLLDPRVCDCCATSAARTATGAIVVYRDRDADEVRDISCIRFDPKTGFSDPAPVHRDGWKIEGCPVNGPSVDASGSRVAVAWYTAAFSPTVLVSFSTDAGRTFSDPIAVDRDDGSVALGRVDVVMHEGDAIVSWMAAIGPRAEIRLSRVSADGRAGAPRVIGQTTSGRASGFPQLERVSDDLVVVFTGFEEGTTTLRAWRGRAREVPGPQGS